jgi:hypothetical protein
MISTCTSASDFIFVDAIGKKYLVKDVSSAGGCALVSLMGNPNFQAPTGLHHCLFLGWRSVKHEL